MFLLASVSLSLSLSLSLCFYTHSHTGARTHTHTHTRALPLLLSIMPVHQWAVMFGVWPQSWGSQDATDAAKSVHTWKSCPLQSGLSLRALENQQMRCILLLLNTAPFYCGSFCTNKCVRCETRQINPDWATCITMSLSSLINMLM